MLPNNAKQTINKNFLSIFILNLSSKPIVNFP